MASNDSHEMEEDENEEMDEEYSDEERPRSEAWRGMNLREQIKANARLFHPSVPRDQFEIYVTEHSTYFNAHLVHSIDTAGQNEPHALLVSTHAERPRLQTPAEALYALFMLTASEAERFVRTHFPEVVS